MNIGPLTAVEYDEPTLQIRSESDVVIQDRDIRVTGQGMMIQLRSKDETAGPSRSSAGFQGAETLYLYKKVHVVMRDVGKSGILPGSVQTRRVAPGEVQVQAQIASRPDQKQATPTAANEPTPMEVLVRLDDAGRHAQAANSGPGRSPRAAGADARRV